ncbi:hypothetical protein J4233_01885 [Candidatus Pacearchaeota archaeon]|nr:hypothetical protein [Candidatus Pacearchaeota archaeon]
MFCLKKKIFFVSTLFFVLFVLFLLIFTTPLVQASPLKNLWYNSLTFLGIIEITSANHLNSDRVVISNVYNEVKELDGIWSETIPDTHYVRIKFEKNLTNRNDITIFPRTISGNPRIEVYEKDGTEKIVEFEPINSNGYNKVYLTNLISESQDVFDLRVVGGTIEIEHIVDPTDKQYFLTGGSVTGAGGVGGLDASQGNARAIWETTAGGQSYTWVKQYTETTTFGIHTFVIGFWCNATESQGGSRVQVDNFVVYDCGTSSNCATQDATICSITGQNIDCNFVTAAEFKTISCTSVGSATLQTGDYLGVMLVSDVNDAKTPDLRLHFNSSVFNTHFNATETTSDTTYPTFSAYTSTPGNNTAYVSGADYQFNSTVADTNGTVGLSFNGINYTASNLSSVFNASVSNLAAGTYSYYWWGYGSGTDKNFNSTSTMSYTVAQATPTLTKALNDIDNNLTVTFPQQVNASGSTTGGTLNITRDGIETVKGANLTLGVAYYRFDFNITGGQNFSNVSQTLYANVTKATPTLTFLANGGTSNLSLIYPQQVNISANTSAGTVGLDKDNVDYSASNGLNVTLSAGSYIFRANISGNQNYSNVDYSYYNVTINKTAPQGNLTNTTSWTVTYPTQTNISYSESNSGDGDVAYNVSRDNVYKNGGENVTLGAGTYSYVLNTTGGANYTANSSMDAKTLTVNQNTTYVLGISGTTPITYGTATNVAGSGCPSELTCSLDKSNIVYGVGTVTFNYSTAGNANYSANSITKDIVINKAVPQGNLTNTTSLTVTYLTATNVSYVDANAGDGDVTYSIYRNNVDVTSEAGTNITLGAGTYNYTLLTTGGTNYTANSSMSNFTVTVSQISSSVNLTLNNSESNATIIAGTAIDLNCSTLTGDSGANLLLYREGSLINNGTSPRGNTTTFNTVQVENITCIYPNSQNYTSSSETWFVHVDATDIIYPTFSSYWDNNATLVGNGASFNVTVQDTNGTVFLEINNTNYTATNVTASVYNVSVLLSNGTYSYYWGSWGNGTSHLYNVSATRSYTVNSIIISACRNITSPGVYTLNQSLNSTGTCITISADNVDLNGNGYNLTYFTNDTVGGPAITAVGRQNLTVKNIVIIGTDAVGWEEAASGIYFTRVNGSVIKNNSIKTTGGTNYGIYLLYTNNTLIEGNTVNTTGDTAYVIVMIDSFKNEITNNSIYFSGATGEGIDMNDNGLVNSPSLANTISYNYIQGTNLPYALVNIFQNFTIISHNTFFGSRTTASVDGIALAASSGNITVINNSITLTGRKDHNGIEVAGDNHYIENNTINSSGIALQLVGGSQVTFRNNTLIDNGAIHLNITSEWKNGTYLTDQKIANYSVLGVGSTLIVKDSVFGEIRFLQTVNGSGTNLTRDIQILNNSAFVNNNTAPIGFNKSANITLYSLSTAFSNPQILKDGAACGSSCYNFTSLNAGTVVFNASSWGNYSIGESATDTCTCAGSGNNWEINMGDYCNVTTTCNLGTGNITFTGTGTTTFNATINTKNLEYPVTNQILNIGSNAVVMVG